MLVDRALRLLDGHKIDDLTYTIYSQKACNDDIGVWKIQLFAFHTRRLRRSDTEKASFFSIEQRPEDAWSIKTWDAAPID
jgi:hypothetical protein